MQSTEEAEQATAIRPTYRAGRRARAVKVYTINQESRYLVVENIPALGLTQELIHLFEGYGVIDEYQLLDDYPTKDHIDVYWIRYTELNEARSAKKHLDDYLFFHRPLRIRYGPEYESVEEVRVKLAERKQEVAASLITTEDDQIDNFKTHSILRDPLDPSPASKPSHATPNDNPTAEVMYPAMPSKQLPDPIASATAMVRRRMDQTSVLPPKNTDDKTQANRLKKPRRRI
ncbi:hypothetical protein BDF19DRAFT_16084 [Syncephalis fuscata]|nr:hypothetical protein BDF19DRAFT_16084 [Syncephalis fuscata]